MAANGQLPPLPLGRLMVVPELAAIASSPWRVGGLVLSAAAAVWLLGSFLFGRPLTTEEKQARAAKQEAERAKTLPRDKVVLYQFAYPKDSASASSPCVKAETILKFCNVEYENSFGLSGSMPKGKNPVYIYNGRLFEDSQLGYEQLIETGLLPDLEQNLSSKEKAVAVAFRRILENSIYLITALERWRDNWTTTRDEMIFKGAPLPIRVIIGNSVRKGVISGLNGAGVGRYSKSEVYDRILPADVAAIAAQLGDNEWLVGTATPTTTDAMLYGVLASVWYNAQCSPLVAAELKKYPNLVSFFHRVRKAYWPDLPAPSYLGEDAVMEELPTAQASGIDSPRRTSARQRAGRKE
ncbi:hypothetical protein DFJ74DRAFT_652987 [Hyaloraphidium curvatum]|nr:hypothetical protein DFJ74DRAFT_652987 [Hyaloraphidium curvatum]